MKGQNPEFNLDRMPLRPRLAASHPEGNGQIAKAAARAQAPAGARLRLGPRNFELRRSNFEVSFPREREREHVRRVVVAKELPIEAAHGGIADERDGDVAVSAGGSRGGKQRGPARAMAPAGHARR